MINLKSNPTLVVLSQRGKKPPNGLVNIVSKLKKKKNHARNYTWVTNLFHCVFLCYTSEASHVVQMVKNLPAMQNTWV